ncbi:hypothetical protein GS429_07605 [Natronorubrum sp. JWXQ-INN-674]|uniref:Uncharacterized protein n=1 Tax=Natronorubrum halalkaliphilum TaxID=2691917 RepID=A0A6B0VME3_9EURY|nr:hypothetical protein [Natronorubrum halalkaliphilum]MXV61922.1 hypothetical protein [Natronorubrum halalkaliphilum]
MEKIADPITTESRFQTALQTLIVDAITNGVPVEGGWECRSSNDDIPDWDIAIQEVTKPFTLSNDRDSQ